MTQAKFHSTDSAVHLRELISLSMTADDGRAIRGDVYHRFLLEHAPMIMMVVDRDRRIRTINAAGARFAGKSVDEMIGMRGGQALGCLFSLQSPDGCGYGDACAACFVRRTVMQSFEERRSFENIEGTLWFLEKDQRYLSVSTAYHVLDGEELVAVYIDDVSERKRAECRGTDLEHRLRQAHKMEALGTLAGGIAHDFNNILFPIIGYVELLADEVKGNAAAGRMLDDVMHAAVRAKNLVKQILSFSRQQEDERIPFQMQMVVKEAVKLTQSVLPSNIRIRHNIQSRCRPVLAAPTQMHQVVLNLITNASHAMTGAGGDLAVTLDEVAVESETDGPNDAIPPGDYVHFSVSDTGTGIDPAVIGRIFDPYFSTKDAEKGTGLGLSVAQGIINAHGGHIRVESRLGEGSTFHVYLPKIETGPRSPSAREPSATPGAGETILAVDDEPQILKMLEIALKKNGYRVLSCDRGLNALEMFRRHPDPIDLVITDMTMPDITGLELSRRLQDVRPGVPVVLMTGFSEQAEAVDIEAAGVRELMMKPILKSDLARIIRSALDAAPPHPQQKENAAP